MANAAEIAAAREAQRTAAARGETLSFRDARQQATQPKDLTTENVTKLFAELATVKADIVATQKDLAECRVTGPGHSGVGPRGMQFKATGGGDDDGGSGVVFDVWESGTLLQYTVPASNQSVLGSV